eukprot:sb/3474803/
MHFFASLCVRHNLEICPFPVAELQAQLNKYPNSACRCSYKTLFSFSLSLSLSLSLSFFIYLSLSFSLYRSLFLSLSIYLSHLSLYMPFSPNSNISLNRPIPLQAQLSYRTNDSHQAIRKELARSKYHKLGGTV